MTYGITHGSNSPLMDKRSPTAWGPMLEVSHPVKPTRPRSLQSTLNWVKRCVLFPILLSQVLIVWIRKSVNIASVPTKGVSFEHHLSIVHYTFLLITFSTTPDKNIDPYWKRWLHNTFSFPYSQYWVRTASYDVLKHMFFNINLIVQSFARLTHYWSGKELEHIIEQEEQRALNNVEK